MKGLLLSRLIGVALCAAITAQADVEVSTSSTLITTTHPTPIPTLIDDLPKVQIPVDGGHGKNASDDDDFTIGNPCDCYVVSGPEPGYFQHYRFYDFRQSPVKGQNAVDSREPVSTKAHDGHGVRPADDERGTAGDYRAHHSSLDGSAFINDWAVQSWDRQGSILFPVSIANSVDNIFMVNNDTDGDDEATHLVLRTTRFEDYTSTAEVESRERNVFHCSFRVRLRLYGENEPEDFWDSRQNSTILTNSTKTPDGPLPANYRTDPLPGVCAGIFTYNSRDVESDIEILTSDPHKRIRYSNQPDWDPITDEDIPGASTQVDLPVPWTNWANHRIDWFPDISRWYLNDDLELEKTYGVPYKPSLLVMNLWSDGGVWSGNLSVGSSVYMGIEWIEVAYNTSSDYEMEHERVRRSADDTHNSRWSDGVEADQNLFPPDQNRLSNEQWDNGYGDEEEEYNNLDQKQYRLAPRNPKKKKKNKGDKGKDPKVNEDGCRAVCRVDDVETIGVPERLWDRWED